MAYLPAFDYDIFISYSHVDNEILPGQQAGWIEQFYKNLSLLLAKRIGKLDVCKIWWDNKKLDGSKIFDESIETGIKKSAIMLSLISPGYLASDYCRHELDLFYKKSQHETYGTKVGDRSRIFNVLINNINYEQWPVELKGTSGFIFHDAKEKDDWGDPMETNNPLFLVQLKSLRDAIVNTFQSFLQSQKNIVEVPDKPVTTNDTNSFSIYFGEVADTLRRARKKAMAEMEKKGYTVLCGVPPPNEETKHDEEVKKMLARADLSVHLLDEYPGKEIINAADIWYPQKQAQIALQSENHKLIWMPAEMDEELIEEDKYKAFVKGISAGKKYTGQLEFIKGQEGSIIQQVTDIAEQLKSARMKPVLQEKVAVLLDTHFNDQVYAMDVGRALLENEIQPFINPQEDDPRKNINLLADRISQVSKLIFFYGKVSRDWVTERMSAALQLIISNNFPVEGFYVYMAPPHKQSNELSLRQRFLKINIIDNSNNVKMDEHTCRLLLKELKGVA